MTEPNYRLPVKHEPSLPPAPLWQQAAPVVIRGAALVAAGVVGQWALRNAARRAIATPFKSKGGRNTKSLAKRDNAAPDVIAVSETLIVRRVIVRR
ncbi:MAG: hypothetical protein WD904_07465 [Dehalococcoidia bacterium]